jgi:hypothetical protein
MSALPQDVQHALNAAIIMAKISPLKKDLVFAQYLIRIHPDGKKIKWQVSFENKILAQGEKPL